MSRRTLLLTVTILLAATVRAWSGWQLYEETNVRGTITGTIQNGSLFHMQSGSVYEVSEVIIIVKIAVAPKTVVLRDGEQFKLIIDGFDQPLLCRQLVLPTSEPKNSSTANRAKAGSPGIPSSGDFPLAKILPPSEQQKMGIAKLTDEEKESLRAFLISLYLAGVEQGRASQGAGEDKPKSTGGTISTIETQIDSDFKGWDGQTIVKLANGQVWQQSEYYYHYHYAFRPNVVIYRSGSGYKMKVDGVDRAVGVTRLK